MPPLPGSSAQLRMLPPTADKRRAAACLSRLLGHPIDCQGRRARPGRRLEPVEGEDLAPDRSAARLVPHADSRRGERPLVPGSETLVTEDTLTLLKQACDRNAQLELHRHAGSGELLVARARMLDFDDQLIYLDSPHSIGKEIHFLCGHPVSAHTILAGKMYAFDSHVADSSCVVQLNKRRRIVGMSIARPTSVWVAQRREDYRVSVVSLDPIPVRVHEISPDCRDAAPIEAVRFGGCLMNISLGGVRVRLSTLPGTKFVIGHPYYLAFQLPTMMDEIMFLCELRHYRPLHDGEETAVGLQFMVWPSRSELQKRLQFLHAFCFEMQRRSLRRRR
jgi:c-di-GMP-binding flagellar brake protein YcgR